MDKFQYLEEIKALKKRNLELQDQLMLEKARYEGLEKCMKLTETVLHNQTEKFSKAVSIISSLVNIKILSDEYARILIKKAKYFLKHK